VLDIVFSVDGERVAHLLVPVPGHMRALAANQRLGGPPLQVEWIRTSPYAASGTFTSRVFDAGATVGWETAAWEADVPEATSVDIHVRTGDTAAPGCGWSRWRRLRQPDAAVGATSRYLQYRATLATTDPAWTPVLRRVRVRYAPASGSSNSSGTGRATGFQ
jgi:hypothetical protein